MFQALDESNGAPGSSRNRTDANSSQQSIGNKELELLNK